jgi:hypothetical protein
MQGEVSRSRSRFGLASFVALAVALVVLALPSFARAGGLASGFPDPQTTNVPYLAWDGEEVKLVKCVPDSALPSTVSTRPNVEFIIEMWSGEDSVINRPYVEESTISAFSGSANGDRSGNQCFSGDVVSLKPGLAVVQLIVNDGSSDRTAVLKHQFLVIWMDLNNPQLVELPNDEFPGAPDVCNPAGGSPEDVDLANFGVNGPGDLCRIELIQTGSFPMGQNFAGLDGDDAADTMTLPTDWAQLASELAVDADPNNPDAGNGQGGADFRWDIHDAGPPPVNTAAELVLDGKHDPDNNTASDACAPPAFDLTESLREPVDSCVQGSGPQVPWGFSANGDMFSTINGPSSVLGIGPFDPERFSETLLSDRVVDAGDAPMPAAKEHVRIADPTAAEPFGGAGSLEPVLKSSLYDRGAASHHRYFAPFYAAYLPATEAPVQEASGIDGPRHLNNGAEGGFLDCGGARTPRVIALAEADALDSTCNARLGEGRLRGPHDPYVFWLFAKAFARDGLNDCLDVVTGKPLPKPFGVNDAVVYTDEHGKAEIAFNPDTGFNRRIDSNGRCDPNPGGGPTINPLGVARITAEAKYPYKAVFQTRRVSNELVKNIISHEQKTLACVPKDELTSAGTLAPSNVSVICAETVLDRFGQPVENALVCFSRTPRGNIDPFFRSQGDIDASGSALNEETATTPATQRTTPDRICIRTNAGGIAAVEVTETLPILVDVKAENELTRNGGSPVFRFQCITFSGAGGPPPRAAPRPAAAARPPAAARPAAAVAVAPAAAPPAARPSSRSDRLPRW